MPSSAPMMLRTSNKCRITVPYVQWKTILRMMTRVSETAASGTGRRYQAFPALSGSWKVSLGVSEYTRPTNSVAGFGVVTMVAATLTTMSTTNATDAATNGTPWPGRLSTPTLDRMKTKIAERVPETRPIQPAVEVIRFQNMPRMNVANNGALKKPNNVCR